MNIIKAMQNPVFKKKKKKNQDMRSSSIIFFSSTLLKKKKLFYDFSCIFLKVTCVHESPNSL